MHVSETHIEYELQKQQELIKMVSTERVRRHRQAMKNMGMIPVLRQVVNNPEALEKLDKYIQSLNKRYNCVKF